jgi:hypothetical protein
MTLQFFSHVILPLTLQVYAFSTSSQLCIRKQKITTLTAQHSNRNQPFTNSSKNVTISLIQKKKITSLQCHDSTALKKLPSTNQPTNHVHADYNFALPATLSQITFQGQGPNCATGVVKRASLRSRVHTVLVDYPAE